MAYRLAGGEDPTSALLAMFPHDRLPTTADWCADYLWQRDNNENYRPCKPRKVHFGTDFLMAAWVLRNM